MVILRASPTRLRLRNGVLALTVGAPEAGQPEGPSAVSGVVDYLGRQAFQRRGTSRELTVNFTYGGVAPASVEARIVNYESGEQITPWAALTGLAVSNGSGSGKMVAPQGCWYRLEVRDAAAPSTVLRGTVQFGVGMYIAGIGQSNMENAPKTYWYIPLGDSRSVGFNRLGQYYRLGRVNDSRPPSQNQGTYGTDATEAASDNGGRVQGDFVIFVANIVAGGLNIPVCFLERAVGGSSIDRWMDDYAGSDSCWARFTEAVAAIGGDVEMALWLQGESNAKGFNPAVHRPKLAKLHAQCRALGGRSDADFHFGVISLGTGAFLGSVDGEFGAVRALLVDYANNTPGAFLAGCAHDAQTGDGVHLNGKSYGRLGPRAGKSALARLGVGVTGAGPRITGASRAGSEVTILVQHTGGTALQDGAGGAGAALTGFEFKDAGGNVLTYSGTSFPTANTIRMTVNGTPATVSYAMMNNPHNSDPSTSTSAVVLASIPCDNVPFLYSTGAPLQPCTAINITGS